MPIIGEGDKEPNDTYVKQLVANLLAHSRLFAGGIARSGAYNRSLTPFGFQQEERTLWEAVDTYINMSPFMYAHKVNDLCPDWF